VKVPENDERWIKSEVCCLSTCPHGLSKTCDSIVRLIFTSFKLPLTLRSPGGTEIHLKRRVLYLHKMGDQCKKDNVNDGELNLTEWRVYNLHRSSMKTVENKKQAVIQRSEDR